MIKTKSINMIEGRMEEAKEGSVRHAILTSAKNYKTSWIELGQALYTVWKDKLYKEWEYMTFEAYTQKEIGIKSQTAMKLLKSYYFLEKEEPTYVQKEEIESSQPASIPSYESVDVLRRAKTSKLLDARDYSTIRRQVLDEGKEPKEVKRDLTMMMRQRRELDPEEEREKRSSIAIKRLVATLKSLKRELEFSKLVPASVIKEVSSLIAKVEAET
jgi:hypothetical protein